MKKLILFFILILALFLRFFNLNWDNNQHLHPDERFMTMVSTSMKLPATLDQYFNQKTSFLNPENLGYKFFVYGSFPLVLNKYLAVFLNKDNYDDLVIVGRYLSALMDFFCVIMIYKIGRLLFDKKNVLISAFNIPVLMAFFYAISVYPIQSAHFFTTDTFLNFFMLASFYFALKSIKNHELGFLMTFFSALFFALALASKISALYILPLNVGVIFLSHLKQNKKFIGLLMHFILHVVCYLVLAYFFLRIFNPYYFQNPSFFDFSLNKNSVESIKSLKQLSTKEAWYPPAVQWINKPWWGLLTTTFFVGLGSINFIVMVGGIIFLISNIKYQKSKIFIKNQKEKNIKIQQLNNLTIYLILFWVIGYFIYQSAQFVKSIRYTLYLYPFYAIFGGIGIALINQKLKVKSQKLLTFAQSSFFYLLLLFWPLLFFTIYLHKNTRVEASEWIYKNLPSQSVILGEYWDDPLPLYVENNYGKNFIVEQLPIFDPDVPEKWQRIRQLLARADYYILSSNRGWGSIPTVPERYPLMSEYYQALLNNDCQGQIKLTGVCYKKIKEFLPYYYKFIRYPDSWIEETFTVYDQPTVLIYKKQN